MKIASTWFLCFVLTLSLLFSAVGETATMQTGQYTRNAQVDLSFSYEAIEMDHCTVAFGPATGLTPDEMEARASDIEEIAAWLWTAFPGAALQKPTVYLLSYTGRNVPFTQQNEAFILAATAFSDDDAVMMMQAMLGHDIRWMAEGCYQVAAALQTGDSPLAEELAEHYATQADQGMLDLLPTRFSSRLNTQEDIALAQKTALSLVTDLLTVDGPEALTQDVTPERMAQWRERAGLPQDTDPGRAAVLRQFRYTFGQINDLQINGEHLYYALNAGDAGLADAAAVEDFVYRTASGRDGLLAYIQANASAENAAYFMQALPDLQFKCREPQGGNKSWFMYPDSIALYNYRLAGYTMAGSMLWQPNAAPVLSAGLAVYLDLQLPQSLLGDVLLPLILKPDADSELAAARDLYIAWAGTPTEQDVDMRVVVDAIAAYENQQYSDAQMDLPQCGSLMYYCIDQYGLDMVLDYIRLGQSEQEAFGKSFNMLHKEWSMALARKSDGN